MCAIVIPIYKPFEALSPEEKASLMQAFKILKNHDIFFACAHSFQTNGYETLATSFDISFFFERFRDIFFLNVDGYSRLLTNEIFYKRFESFSHILIYQLDAWIFKNDLSYWIGQNYDYVGAPVFENFEFNTNYKYSIFLNGGLSLRKVDSSIRIINRVKKLRRLHFFIKIISLKRIQSIAPIINLLGLQKRFNIENGNYLRELLGGLGTNNEDLRWSWAAETFSDFTKPSPEMAKKFAFELHSEYLLKENGGLLPMACHAWEKYDSDFWSKYINLS